jgi:hypothetical protein
MDARVLPFRAPFYAIVPGGSGPGRNGAEPIGYEKTYDGLMSAITHARLLSAGGATQDVLLTAGKNTRVIMRFTNGAEITGKLLPPPDFSPATVTELRPGSPHGHIPEACTHGKNRASGRTPRRSPHMPRKATWPGMDI